MDVDRLLCTLRMRHDNKAATTALAEATATAVTLGLQFGAPPAVFTSKADRIGMQIVPDC